MRDSYTSSLMPLIIYQYELYQLKSHSSLSVTPTKETVAQENPRRHLR